MAVLVIQLVLRLAAVVGGFDESVSERTEDGPHGWNGHGDEDNPFFDLSPAEENTDAVCKMLINVCQGWGAMHDRKTQALTRRVSAHDELGCPCSDNGRSTGKNTASHEETQTPFQLFIDAQGDQHRDGYNGEVEIGDSSHGTHEVGVVYTSPVVTLCLSKRIPQRTWGTALEPNEQDLGNVEDDI